MKKVPLWNPSKTFKSWGMLLSLVMISNSLKFFGKGMGKPFFQKRFSHIFLIIITSIIGFSLCITKSTETIEIPPDEMLYYRINFRGIPAGEAYINVETDGKVQRIVLTAKSYPVIDVFYPIRVKAISVFSLPDYLLLNYEKFSQEGHGREKLERIIFNHNQGYLTYYKNDKEKKRLEITRDIQDPFSCIYSYRRFSDKISEMSLYITDGKKIIKGHVNILKKERIRTPAGDFDTVLVEPIMEGVSGVFSKSPGSRLFVWISDDERKIPVQLKSSISIGEFTAVLVDSNYNNNNKKTEPRKSQTSKKGELI